MKNIKFIFISVIFFILILVQNFNVNFILNVGFDSKKDISSKYIFDNPINIVADIDYKPFSFINENGLPDGFDIELINLISKKIGFETKIELLPWTEACKRFENKEADIILGLEYLSNLDYKYNFSSPIINDEYFAFGKSKIKSFDELYNYKIAAIKESSLIDFVIEPFDLMKNTTLYNSYQSAFKSISNNENDFVFCKKSVGKAYSKIIDKKIKQTGPSIRKDIVVFAIQKDNDLLLEAVDEALYSIKKSDSFNILIKKWLNSSFKIKDIVDTIRSLNMFFSIIEISACIAFFIYSNLNKQNSIN